LSGDGTRRSAGCQSLPDLALQPAADSHVEHDAVAGRFHAP